MVAIGAMQLVYTTAMTALVTGASPCGKSSFGLVLVLLLWRGRDALTQESWLDLGKSGLPLDIVALTWVVRMCVWMSFPLYVPVTPSSMNYARLVFAGVSLASTVC